MDASPEIPGQEDRGLFGSRLVPLLLAAGLLATSAAAARAAAVQPAPRHGGPTNSAAAEAGLLLRQLGSARRVLLVAAHPDDEDTALLAELDRSRGVRTAYLSLTRGEGGQNVIGPELGEGLGLIRTGELLAARRLDGAEQYFTRAYDFGYSKTAEETFEHWPRERLLRDVVWRIRSFRPHVVVSIFSGTPNDGHGHHQVAGILARSAFRAAADSTRFTDQLERGVDTWAADKLYRRAWRDPDRATLRVPTGEYDPLLGRSPFQLAMEGRSQHRSQGFGTVQPPGPRFTRLLLVENRTEAGPGEPLFAGVDTSLSVLADALPPGEGRPEEMRDRVEALRRAADRARDSLRVLDAGAAAPALRDALAAAREAERLAASVGAEGPRRVLARQAAVARRALMAASGVSLRFRAEDDLWVPGQTLRVHAELWNGSDVALRAGAPELDLPAGWDVRLLPPDSVRPTASERSRFYGSEPAMAGGSGSLEVAAGAMARWSFRVTVPDTAAPTQQYFLRRERAGDLYRWPDDPDLHGRPHSPPLAVGRLPLRLEGAGSGPAAMTAVRREVRYRGVDKARGEYWRPVHVVPRLSIAARPEVMISPAGGEGAARTDSVAVTVRSHVEDSVRAALSLRVPGGWSTEPGRRTVLLAGSGASETRSFRLRRTGGHGDGTGSSGAPWTTHRIAAEARAAAAAGDTESASWDRELSVIDYPHIEPAPLFRDADLRIERFPVEVDRDLRVGYVMGTGDDVPTAIRQLGLPVTMIGAARLRSGDLGEFDVIVVGVRAYEVREDLQAANPRLLDWAREEGGTLIVQYNKYEFVEGDYAPFRATMARPHDRVTDERAEVSLLHPEAPPLSSPNDIGDRDFRGWVQERGLYFLHEWGDAFTPLLSMADPGEEPRRGSLLVAPLGRGLYVYTGLAFFRQLPAGVPGAYRLFANLLSLEPGEWRSWLDAGSTAPADGGQP
ncbi:MAG: PIG-L family deacetylase [Candidatus Palauibacterales bacterium]|nr:PIG-L family deacetylase [Candidatus Palauibacterales bacterium]